MTSRGILKAGSAGNSTARFPETRPLSTSSFTDIFAANPITTSAISARMQAMSKTWDFFTDSSCRLDELSDFWRETNLPSLRRQDPRPIQRNENLSPDATLSNSTADPESSNTAQEEGTEQENQMSQALHGSVCEYEWSDSDDEARLELESDFRLLRPRLPARVRDFLNAGELARLLDEHLPHSTNRNLPQKWSFHQWPIILVAPCAMMLGCTFPAGFLDSLWLGISSFMGPGFPFDILCRACIEYVDGKPYQFDHIWVGSDDNDYGCENSPKPPQLEPGSPIVLDSHIEEIMPIPPRFYRKTSFNHGSDSCANCGDKRGFSRKPSTGEGNLPLQRCKRCKTTTYCFKGCQKWHWWEHERFCNGRYKQLEKAGLADADPWKAEVGSGSETDKHPREEHHDEGAEDEPNAKKSCP